MPNGFIKQSVIDFNNQQINFNTKIGNYTLGLTAANILAIKADAAYLTWEIGAHRAYLKYGESWTSFENDLFSGATTVADALPPPLPTLAAAPTGVTPGMRGRFSDIAAACKVSANYTKTIGIDLGIVAVDPTFDPQSGKPAIKETLQAGHPHFKYVRGEYEGVQIYKDSADGNGFVKFDKATKSDYTDTTALPASGVAVLWKYRFIFLYDDAEVGSFSNVVEVLVTGI